MRVEECVKDQQFVAVARIDEKPRRDAIDVRDDSGNSRSVSIGTGEPCAGRDPGRAMVSVGFSGSMRARSRRRTDSPSTPSIDLPFSVIGREVDDGDHADRKARGADSSESSAATPSALVRLRPANLHRSLARSSRLSWRPPGSMKESLRAESRMKIISVLSRGARPTKTCLRRIQRYVHRSRRVDDGRRERGKNRRVDRDGSTETCSTCDEMSNSWSPLESASMPG